MRLYMVVVFWDWKKICAGPGRMLFSLPLPGQKRGRGAVLLLFPQSSDFRIRQTVEKDVPALCNLHPVVAERERI